MIKHKENAATSKNKKLEIVLSSLDDMYERYSILADETLKAKSLEEITFEDYIVRCQEKEKAIVDAGIEASSQQTRIKLLLETLSKRSQEHDRLLRRSKELVSRT